MLETLQLLRDLITFADMRPQAFEQHCWNGPDARKNDLLTCCACIRTCHNSRHAPTGL